MDFWNIVDEVRYKKVKNRRENANYVGDSVDNSPTSKRPDTKKKEDELDKTSELVIDAVLMTAVEDEYLAARNVFRNSYGEYFENGFKYSLVNCEIGEDKSVILAVFRQNNMGLVSASMTATYALNKFEPKIILMCGVCAGVEGKANFGDLIVFSPVYDYGSGKYSSGKFLPDYRQRQLSGNVRPIVEQMCCDVELKRTIKDTWQNQTGKPNTELAIHIYPGGSGASVITDENVIDELKLHQRTLGAIDMESYAVAEVANASMTKEVPWLVVKGVQDFATPLKNDQYREYAAYVSSVFIKKFLEKFFE